MTVTVLISSAGRRVELLRAFRRAVAAADETGGRVLAVDCSWYSGAFHDADDGFLVPRCDSPNFVPKMLELCERQRVDLIVPTLDPELPVYAEARDSFAEVGTTVAVSSPGVVAISGDKQLTHDWLVSNGFPTVAQGSVDDVLDEPDAWQFPLVVKPRRGSASIGVEVVPDVDALRHAAESSAAAGDLVVQTRASGTEHTIDVLASPDGACLAVVPRRRLEVRAGEVSKGVTVRSPALIELAEKLCAALPEPFGALNFQVFVDDAADTLAVIELNARFGGGYPLSLAAGADFPLALVQSASGRAITAPLDGWRDGLLMLRYDAAVFVQTQGGQCT